RLRHGGSFRFGHALAGVAPGQAASVTRNRRASAVPPDGAAGRRVDRILAMDLTAILSPPLVTADLPGIGGRIKTELEDFEVEELPAYEPSGAGEFLYLWIEKRDMGAEYFTRQVAKRLDVAVGEVGAAGLKDRR